MNNPRANSILIAAGLLLAIGIGVFVWRGPDQAAAEKDSDLVVDPAPATAAATTPAVLSPAVTNPPPGPGLVPDYDWFQRRPFAVAQTNGTWQWTAVRRFMPAREHSPSRAT